MKVIFVTNYFTGQSNASCFDSVDKLLDDLSGFYDGHDKHCAVHTIGQWSGTPQTGMMSNCTCGVIGNNEFKGFVKPFIIDDDELGVWYDHENDIFSREKPSIDAEFLVLNWSCYQKPDYSQAQGKIGYIDHAKFKVDELLAAGHDSAPLIEQYAALLDLI